MKKFSIAAVALGIAAIATPAAAQHGPRHPAPTAVIVAPAAPKAVIVKHVAPKPVVVAHVGPKAGAFVQIGARPVAWQNINQRQARLDARINQGIRSGALTRGEAALLKAQFRNIAQLEARYRATGGLSLWERNDLDRRFDALSARIQIEKNDRQVAGFGGRYGR